MADPKIKIKRSSVEGKIPTADQVPLGEIALNTYDGKLFASKNVGIGTTVFAINPWSVGTGTNTYNTFFTVGNVGIGTTNPTESLSVVGKIQVHQDNSSNNRLIFRGQPGSSYRWNIDNYSSANEFRIFREDDATSANGSVAVSISTTGTVTATKFSGDGSLLTGITASGSGVVIKDDGSTVGTAGTIDFGTGLSVSFSSGTATVNASGGSGSSQWVTTDVGIHTLSNVGIGTTNPTSKLTVSGNASITGILTADQIYTSNNGNGQNVRIGDDLWIGDVNLANTTRFSGAQDSTKAFVIFGSSDSVALGRTGTGPLYYGGNFTVAGIVTASSFSGNASSASYATSSGIATYATTAGIATYATSAGIATYATSAGIASALTATASVNTTGIITASQLSTGASGTGINVTTNTLSGPAEITIDPAAVGDNTGAVRIKGDLYVDGTQTFINSTTIELADFNVGIATTVGTDALLDGAGIGIGSTGIRKTLTWDNTNTALKSSENFNLATGKVYEIDGTTVLSSNTLGSGVVNSSLTSVGTLTNLSVGNVNSTGVVTASNGFVGNLTGTATTATNLSDAANITAGTINSARLSGTYNIDITGSAGYATTAGIATYATNAGVSTYATSSGIATYADYATSAGIATYATSAGIATYATSAGIATYATSAGLSTNVKGDGSRVLYNSATDTTTTSSNLTFDGTTLAVNSTPGANTSAVLLTGTPFGSNTKNGLLGVGTLGFTDNNIIANFATNVNSYAQVILQNLNSGNAASSDFIVNSDSPLGQDYYGDFGINGTAYNGGGPFGDTSGTYLYAKGGTLAVGTDDAQDFRIATGSAVATPVTRVTVTGTTGNVGVGTTTPSSKLSVVGDGNFTDVVTATSFSGSGTNLTGIVTSIVAGTNITISGSTGQVTINSTGGGGSIGIQSAGVLVGTATTINFGSGVTITNNVASVSVGSTTRFAGARLFHDDYTLTTTGAWTKVINWDGTAIDTHSFVDASNGFTIPAGVSKVRFTIGARSSTGTVNNQWNIYKNGSQLSINDGGIYVETEANTGYGNGSVTGTTAVLSVTQGDIFDLRYFVSSTTPTWDIFFEIEVIEGNILGTYFSANNIVDDTTPQLGGDLDLNSNDITGTGNLNVTGIVTATRGNFSGIVTSSGAVISGVVTANSFVGDGSLLTGITAASSGVVVQNQGSIVGTATTINFSTNLTASFSSGTATITATGGGGGGGITEIDLLEVMMFA